MAKPLGTGILPVIPCSHEQGYRCVVRGSPLREKRDRKPLVRTGLNLQAGCMVMVHVHVQVKPEAVGEFRAASLANAQASVREPGVARFDVCQQSDDPTRFLLVEVYRDADAPARHKETRHYATWRDAVAGMMAEPRRSVIYHNAFPPDSGW